MRCGKDFDGYEYDEFIEYTNDIIEETVKELCSDDQCSDGFEGTLPMHYIIS